MFDSLGAFEALDAFEALEAFEAIDSFEVIEVFEALAAFGAATLSPGYPGRWLATLVRVREGIAGLFETQW